MIKTAVAPLFVPGDKIEILPKAASSAADAVILDLEDAVASDKKQTARDALKGPLPCDIIVRINDIRTPWFDEDVAALGSPHIVGVMLPKTECAQDLIELKTRLAQPMAIIALVETAKGLENINIISQTCDRLAFGSLDFAADLGCTPDAEALLYARSKFVMAAKLSEKPAPLDGVTPNFRDHQACALDTAHAVKLGFGGKLCIHPSQIDIVQTGFRPSQEEIAWAQQVLASKDGANALDGMMVDAPIRMRAEQILARS